MSSIDEAFIRAYRDDALPAVAPAAPRSVGETSAPRLRIHSQDHALAAKASISEEGARRPLSSFAQQTPKVDGRFKPSFEVDAFRWSAVCDELVERYATCLRPVQQTLVAADDAGRSLIGVGGVAAGAGATTLVASLARLLVEAGKTVAIVDADFAAAGLAESLGLAVEIGWEDVLAGRVPLAEAVVHSIADRIAIVPLRSGGAAAAAGLDSIHASVTAGVLRYHYDMVLFDLGALAEPARAATASRVARQCRLDGLILAAGPHRTLAANPQRLMQTAPELAAICLGVVENQLTAA
jgi:Mrp family chromosome partitioning ATPase